MKTDNQHEKPGLVLRKKYRDLMEAENLSIEELLDKKRKEREERERTLVLGHFKNNPNSPQDVGSIDLINNLTNLGFERRFFTRKDAEFLDQQIDKWEEENSIWEPIRLSEEMEEDYLQTLIETGICYDFKNIGVTIYSTWLFTQTNCDDGSSYIDYGKISYLYNHFSKEFKEINRDDFFEIDFSL